MTPFLEREKVVRLWNLGKQQEYKDAQNKIWQSHNKRRNDAFFSHDINKRVGADEAWLAEVEKTFQDFVGRNERWERVKKWGKSIIKKVLAVKFFRWGG